MASKKTKQAGEPQNGSAAAQVTAEQAQLILQQQEQQARLAFVDEYNALVNRTGFQLVGFAMVRENGTLGVRFDVQRKPAQA